VTSSPHGLSIALLCVALGCAHGAVPATARVTGSVAYRQRVALAPDARLELQLLDVTRADAPAVVIAERTLEAPGQVPIPFDLAYDAARIDGGHRYALAARITEGGALRFINDVSTPVITRGAPSDVALVLRMVSGEEVDDSEAPLGAH
jgi:putative lipoprotein